MAAAIVSRVSSVCGFKWSRASDGGNRCQADTIPPHSATSIPRLAASGALLVVWVEGLAELSIKANPKAYGTDHTGSLVGNTHQMEDPKICSQNCSQGVKNCTTAVMSACI